MVWAYLLDSNKINVNCGNMKADCCMLLWQHTMAHSVNVAELKTQQSNFTKFNPTRNQMKGLVVLNADGISIT